MGLVSPPKSENSRLAVVKRYTLKRAGWLLRWRGAQSVILRNELFEYDEFGACKYSVRRSLAGLSPLSTVFQRIVTHKRQWPSALE